MKRNQYWYPVDNAGKIFPAVSNDARSSVFRLSFYLNEPVNKELLGQAVNEVLKRFDSFHVELKNGLFWNYLSRNKRQAIIKEESPIICRYVPPAKNNGYLFSVFYYKNKITLETFHCISDGTGALEFLKSIVYYYEQILGNPITDPEGKIMGMIAESQNEAQDMFLHTYDTTKKKVLKEEPAYHLTGEKFKDYFTLLIRAKVSTEELKKICHHYQVTIGEYMTAVTAFSIYSTQLSCRQSKRPIKIFVPVNLRRFFPSKTMRNFSLYIKATFSEKKEWTFLDMLASVTEQFQAQLKEEDLKQRINSNVGIEKNLAIRLLPLFIKNLAFQMSYYFLAENINTYAISNLGPVSLPTQLLPYVKDMEFSIGGTSMSILSYQGETSITMTTQFKDLSMINAILDQLKRDQLSIQIATNYREALDEIL